MMMISVTYTMEFKLTYNLNKYQSERSCGKNIYGV